MQEAIADKTVKIQKTWFRDLVLGGEDGLVNVLGLILGIIAANGSPRILIAAAFAEACSEAVSIGSSVYLATLTQRDQYIKRLKDEAHKIETNPKMQKKILSDLYENKGFKEKLLNEILKTITKNKKNWRDILVHERFHLQPVDTKAVWRTTITAGTATLIGSLIPIIPYVFLARSIAIPLSIAICGSILFAVGAYKGKTSVGHWFTSGLQMLMIGFGAALVGFLAGRLFHDKDG